MSDNYLGKDFKKLGFGLMRLPMNGDSVDIKQVTEMTDYFIENGFNYFDTAYIYLGGKSETAIREALVKRYPRESYILVDKLPIWEAEKPSDMEKILDIQRERTGVEYFDFYHLHNVTGTERVKKYEDFGAWDFLFKLKERGIAKHVGFSFHDTPENLDKLLTKHPEAEYVQLQINYGDWDNPGIQSRRCYEVARSHNKPVIIMEPVKGGSLANLGPDIEKLYKDFHPDMSVASWAIRYAASLPGIITVLSGMSTIGQMHDNVSYMKDFKPLSEGEYAVINKVLEKLSEMGTVPCTGCRYCMDGCPQKILIPQILTCLNHYKMYNNITGARFNYNSETREGGKASQCIECRSCENICPQHIEITKYLKESRQLLEP